MYVCVIWMWDLLCIKGLNWNELRLSQFKRGVDLPGISPSTRWPESGRLRCELSLPRISAWTRGGWSTSRPRLVMRIIEVFWKVTDIFIRFRFRCKINHLLYVKVQLFPGTESFHSCVSHSASFDQLQLASLVGGFNIWSACKSACAVPVECSCRPTSNDSLSVRDLDVFKQVRYCGINGKKTESVWENTIWTCPSTANWW